MCGDFDHVLIKAALTLTDVDVLTYMRMAPPGGACDATVGGDEQLLAQRCFDFVRCVLKRRLLSTGVFQNILPFSFCALLSENAEQVRRALDKFELLHTVLEAAERGGHEDVWLRSFVADLIWTRMAWPRNLLIALWEVRFQYAPPDVRSQLEQFAEGFLTTKSAEDMFNVMRDKERSTKNEALKPRAVWHFCRTSRLSEETDRAPPPIIGVASGLASEAQATRSLPAAMFQADQVEFSLGADSLKRMTSKQDWPSHSAANFPLVGMATNALLECDGVAKSLKQVWRCVLLVPGSVIKPKDSQELFLVLHACHLGALLWPVFQKQVAGGIMLDMWDGENPRPARQLSTYELEEWQAAEVTVLPPSLSKKYHDESCGSGMKFCMCLLTKATSIIEYSARRCFPGVAEAYLNKVWDMLGIRGCARPTTVLSLCRALLKRLFPGMAEPEIERILALRKVKAIDREPNDSVLLHTPSVEMVMHLLSEDMQGEVLEFQKAKGMHGAQSSDCGNHKAKSASGASSSGDGGFVAKKVSILGAKTPDWARTLLPTAKGCVVKKDDVRHMRWQSAYPTPQGQLVQELGERRVH